MLNVTPDRLNKFTPVSLNITQVSIDNVQGSLLALSGGNGNTMRLQCPQCAVCILSSVCIVLLVCSLQLVYSISILVTGRCSAIEVKLWDPNIFCQVKPWTPKFPAAHKKVNVTQKVYVLLCITVRWILFACSLWWWQLHVIHELNFSQLSCC